MNEYLIFDPSTGMSLDISFFTGGQSEPFLVLHKDGTIHIGSFVKPDEAAQLFLDTLTKAFPAWRASLQENLDHG